MTIGHLEHSADPSIPRILGLYETHLTVADLQRSIAFYRDVLKLEVGTVIESRNVAFLWIDDKRMGMLGLWETGCSPLKMRLHIAFQNLSRRCTRLRSRIEGSWHSAEGVQWRAAR